MSAVVVFILFVICLMIAIPCNPIHVWRTGQLSVACGSDVCIVWNYYGAWWNLEKIV